MDSMSDRARRLDERLRSSEREATWQTPADLARRAMEGVTGADTPGRFLRSMGRIQLTGAGVTDHTSGMEEVGQLMVEFQKSVTATGAAHQGHTALRGVIPAQTQTRTKLDLLASPYPGSVVLDFMPKSAPEAELQDARSAPLFGEHRRQLADEAVETLLDILAAGGSLGPDVDSSDFLGILTQYGPRVASAVRNLTKVVAAADIDAGFTWDEPQQPSRRLRLTSSAAEHMSSVIRARELDHGEVTLEGVLRTVSGEHAWALRQADDQLISFHRGALSDDDLHEARVDQHVRIVVDAVERQAPGGGEVRYEYTAKRILLPST